MIHPNVHANSARRTIPHFLTHVISDEERSLRHLVAIHSPDAPTVHDFTPHAVPAHYVPTTGLADVSLVAPRLAAVAHQGLDYSSGRPSVQAMQQWGSIVSIRYDPYGPGGTWKQWTDAERASLHAGGIGLHPNFEVSGDEPFGGKPEGSRLGVEVARALGPLGVPTDGTVGDFYSTDREITTTAEMDTVIEFYAEYNRVLRDAGMAYGSGYGQFWLMLRLAKDLGLPGWQTYAWSYGSVWDAAAAQAELGRPELGAPLYQWNNSQLIDGQDVDLNHVLDPYRLRAWWPAGSPFVRGADDMSQADVDNIKIAISAAVDNINQHVNADRSEAKVLTQGAIGAVNAAADNVNQHVNAVRDQNVAMAAMLTSLAAGQVTAADVATALAPQLSAAILAGLANLPTGTPITADQIKAIADATVADISALLNPPKPAA